jgi:hypothetical protein
VTHDVMRWAVAEGEAVAGRQQGADGGGGPREEAKRRRAAEKRAKETQKRDAARLKAQAKKVRKQRGRCGLWVCGEAELSQPAECGVECAG